jgi:molybdate transport system ATP-binding protein
VTCLEAVVSGFHETMGLFEAPSWRQRKKARRWLECLQLDRWLSTPLYELSVGLQRMVFLARALVKEPWLLILDEPCQGLDPQHRALLIRAVNDLISAGGVTAIYVTHRADEIPKSIKRVLRLSGGRGTMENR